MIPCMHACLPNIHPRQRWTNASINVLEKPPSVEGRSAWGTMLHGRMQSLLCAVHGGLTWKPWGVAGIFVALPGAVEEPPTVLGRLSGVPVTPAASSPRITAFAFSFASACSDPGYSQQCPLFYAGIIH